MVVVRFPPRVDAVVRQLAHNEGLDGFAAQAAVGDVLLRGRGSGWARVVGEAAQLACADSARALLDVIRRGWEAMLAAFRRLLRHAAERLRPVLAWWARRQARLRVGRHRAGTVGRVRRTAVGVLGRRGQPPRVYRVRRLWPPPRGAC